MDPTSTTAPPAVELELVALARDAWNLFTERPGTHLAAYALLVLLGGLSFGLLGPPLLVGYIRLIERARNDEPISAVHIFDGFSAIGPALLVGLAYTAAVALGSLVVVLPGIVVAVLWCYALWFVALERQDAGAALRSAWAMARYQIGPLLLLLLAVVGLNILGGLFVVGIFFTGPLGLILMTLAFAQLKGR